MPFVRPLVKLAATPASTAEIPGLRRRGASPRRDARTPARRSSTSRSTSSSWRPTEELERARARAACPPADAGDARPRGRAAARRRAPGDHGRHEPLLGPRRGRRCARSPRRCGIPVFLNGLARGCVPADHELAFSRARSTGLKGADVALVIGVPMDFRLGFGGAFGEETEIIAIDVAEPERAHPRAVAAELYGDLPRHAARAARGRRRRRRHAELGRPSCARSRPRSAPPRRDRARRRARAAAPDARVRASSREVLDRDAIVIVDGGDFVSYAGRVVDSYEPGCWLDPGPFGCLGCGPGYALAAKLAHPDRQVVLLLGDGAFGFSRHGVRHARPPRRQRRRRDGQQRHLGAREAPDGVPLRLLGRRRPAPGDALRRGRRGARRPRRARARAGRAARRARRARSRPASRRSSTCSPTRPSPTRAPRTWRRRRARAATRRRGRGSSS